MLPSRHEPRLLHLIGLFALLLGLLPLGLLATAAPTAAAEIDFIRKSTVFATPGGDSPTSVAMGPDGRLYVATISGRIHALTFDSDYNVVSFQTYLTIYNTPNFNDDGTPATGVTGRMALGITVDPASTPSQPIVYVSHSDPRFGFDYDANALAIDTKSGMITRLVGPNLDLPGNRVDIVKGLPRSRKNHGTNAVEFAPDGWLYIGQGGNTSLGAHHPIWTDLPEQYLSAAVLRADARNINSAVDVSDVASAADLQPFAGVFELYATGFRNPYDLVWHSDGSLYLNDNGANPDQGVTPGPAHGCPNGAELNPSNQPDKLFDVAQGMYGGHPNPARGECILDAGTLYFPQKPPEPDYVPPLHLYDYWGGAVSVNGVAEYPVDEMAGDLISATFSGDRMLRQAQLGAGGSVTVSTINEVGAFDNPVDVAIDQSGVIYVAEFGLAGTPGVSVLVPDGLLASGPSLDSVTPSAGPEAGGTLVTLSGANFATGANVTFDGLPAINVTVSDSTTITANTPAHAPGAVAVAVTNPDGRSDALADSFIYTEPGGNTSLVRVNSGGGSYDGSTGTWSADTNFTGGSAFSSSGAIANTPDQQLYRSERYGNFSYSFSIPNGNYIVILKFAEIFFTSSGQRVFDVAVNGQPALDNFDILSETSPNTALDKNIPANVTNGDLTVTFTSVVNNAKLSAIEIVSSGGGDTTPPTVLNTSPPDGAINVDVETSISVTFSEPMDQAATEGAFSISPQPPPGSFAWNLAGTVMTFSPFLAVRAFDPDRLYTVTVSTAARDVAGNNLTAPVSWEFTTEPSGGGDTTPPAVSATDPLDNATNVPVTASVSVTFSEPMNQAATQAAFSLTPSTPGSFSWNGAGTILTFTPNADLTAGQLFDAGISAGASDLAGNPLGTAFTWSFTTSAGSGASVLRINAGGGVYTSPTSGSWSADTGFTGGSGYATGSPIAGTSDDVLYQSERFGTVTYSFPLSNGSYQVILKFAEIYWQNPGQRVFDVTINGQLVLDNFDILSETSPLTALDKSFAVTVTNGTLTLTLTTVVDNAKLSAIEVVALAGGDTTPPTVQSTSPVDAAVDVAVTSNLSVTFSEAMDAATTEAAFSLSPSVAGSFSWNGAGTTLTFNPTSDLTAGQQFTLTVGTGAQDLAGNTLTAPFNASFTTASGQAPPPTLDNITPTSGPASGGTSVTLSGSEFVAGATVSFGGVAATNVIVVNSSTITATTPAHAQGAVDVVVTNPDGQSDSLTSGFTYSGGGSGTSVARINSGGSSFNGSTGVWSADTGFSGGGTYGVGGPIANTVDDALYQTERHGNFTYTITLPNGAYTVALKFAEIYWQSPGQRVFDVAINGQLVLDNFDILAETSPMSALDKTFPATVSNGTMTITFTTVVNNALVSAIEVFNTSGDTTSPAVSGAAPANGALNVPLDSSLSVTFSEPMNQAATEAAFSLTPSTPGAFSWNGAGTVLTFNPTGDLADDQLYNASVSAGATDLAGNPLTSAFNWSFSTVAAGLPAPQLDNISPSSGSTDGGTAVTLSGANFVDGAAVTFDGLPALNVDVVSGTTITAGTPAQASGAVDVVVTNPDGQSDTLAGGFTYTGPGGGASVLRINAGGGVYTSPTSGNWSADTGFTGGSGHATTSPIGATTDDLLYQSERFGAVTYSFPLPNGSYQVILKFAEIYWQNPGQRVFDVTINGQLVLDNFDILSETGPLTVLDKSFAVTVTNGTLTLTLTTVVDNAKLSAIEVVQLAGGDTTPPTVVSTSPVDAAVAVAVTSNISVTFSEAMDTATTEAVFSLSPSVAGSFSWNGTGTTLTFDPAGNLAAEQLYTVTIGAGAEDLAGNPLATAFNWSFTTEDDAGEPDVGTWTTLPPLPEPRAEVAVVEAGGMIYVLGGGSPSGLSNDVFVYDPVSQEWDEVAPYPGPAVDHAGAAAVNGIIYLIGGLTAWPSAAVNTVYAYDPATDTWAPRANLPRDRGAMGVAVLDGKIYTAGGLVDGGIAVADLAVYDPQTNTWTPLAPLPTARDHLTMESVNGMLYALGGRPVTITSPVTANETYDPVSNTWQARAPLPVARGGHGSAVLDGKIIVFGGEGNPGTPSGVFANTDEYDPAANSWRALAPMISPRHGMDGAVLDGVIYVPGGGATQGASQSTTHEAFSMLTQQSTLVQTTLALLVLMSLTLWLRWMGRRASRHS